MGAWIETGNLCRWPDSFCVAPRVGAWIETNNSDYKSQIEASHPVWVRGLKQSLGNTKGKFAGVAPRVGAWIETLLLLLFRLLVSMSHPVWVRGLKLCYSFYSAYSLGRTPCGCVD